MKLVKNNALDNKITCIYGIICFLLIITNQIKLLILFMGIKSLRLLFLNIYIAKNIKLNAQYVIFSLVLLQYLIIFRDVNTGVNIGKLKSVIEIGIVIGSFVFSIKFFLKNHKIYTVSQLNLIIYLLYILFNTILLNKFNYSSLFWAFKFLILYIIVYNFVKRASNEDNIDFFYKWIYITISILHCIMWIYALIDLKSVFTITTVNQTYRFGGIIIHPSTMSILSSIMLILAIYFKFYRNENYKFHNLNILVSCISLIATYGRVGIFVGIFLSYIYYIRQTNKNKKYILISIVPLFIMLFLLIILTSPQMKTYMINIISRNSGIKDIISFNGRYEIWRYFFNDIVSNNKLIIGYGFGNISSIINESSQTFSKYAFSMENAYLNILVELGVLGICLFSTILINTFIDFIKGRNLFPMYKDQLLLSFLLLLVILLEGLFVPSFGGLPRIQSFILITIILINTSYCSKCKSRIKRGQ